jgi:twinkle protein
MQIYEDGGAKCYVCEKSFSAKQLKEGDVVDIERPPSEKKSPLLKSTSRQLTMEEVSGLKLAKGDRDRQISTAVYEFFKVKNSFNSNGKVDTRFYPYPGGYNARRYPKDGWYRLGKLEGLFGEGLPFVGGNRRLILTTGEEDAMAFAEAMMDKYGKIYPVMSAGSDTNLKLLLERRELVRQYDEVVLAFDEDASGRAALEKAIKIVGIDKVKITKLPQKDANDVLRESGGPALINAMFDAQSYTPGGFLSRDELWEKMEADSKVKSLLFPDCLAGVNKKTKGKRYGDITLFISGTGSGKSTILREDALFTKEHHLVDEDGNPDPSQKIGWIALEEGPGESARKFSGMALNKNPAAQDEPMTLEEMRPGFDAVFGSDQFIVLDHQGSVSDTGLIEKMEWLCLKGCKHIYLDHITIAASEGFEGSDGNEAIDKFMNALLTLVKRYEVWIGVVSHLRKVSSGSQAFEEGKLPSMDDIKGSGSIKQISMDIVAFARNMRAKKDNVRNKIEMEVLKCRYTGLTGPVAGASYVFETGRLNYDETIYSDDEEEFEAEKMEEVEETRVSKGKFD